MRIYKIVCTFGNFGTKPKILKWLNKENVKFEDCEYLGEEDEHHTGVFTEYFGVDEEYADAVIDHIVDSYDIDDLTDYVRHSLMMEFIKSKRAFRRACHSYEEIWGESE